MDTFELHNGSLIPVLGIGTWNMKVEDVENAITAALQAGYRHIDCAYIYANEAEIGKVLEKVLPELGLSRKDLFITSKLWMTCHKPEDVEKACRNTLQDLRLDYLDLYLIHWPLPIPDSKILPLKSADPIKAENIPLESTWAEMENLVKKGLTRSIGLSNFNKRQIDNILNNCTIKPANLQIEIHANFPNLKLVDYAKSCGMVVTAYAPIGSPLAMPGNSNLLTEPWVKSIAEKHNRSCSQVLIRYLLQRDLVVIPKSSNPQHIRENKEVFDFSLTEEEMDILNTSGSNQRQFLLKSLMDHPQYPFNDEY